MPKSTRARVINETDIVDVIHDRIFEADDLSGTYSVYGGTQRSVIPFVCDVELQTLHETWPEELRAYRERQRSQRKPVPPLREDALHDELLVIFGPEMSAGDAIATLRMLANQIERNGLFIGRDEQGNFRMEPVSSGRRKT